jgi:hypothetical protein
VAGAFPGIARDEVDPTLQRIRQAVAVQLNPSAHFDTKVLWGPFREIGLAEDRAIICIRVPRSLSAPHVHKTGQIYRRVADGSEPRPEGDRHVLDQLFRRADDLREQYRSWVDRDPEFTKGEEKRPYIRLLLVADLWRERDTWMDATVDEIRGIMGQAIGIVGAVPFDTVHTMNDGFIARQLRQNDPFNLGLTWHLQPNLVSDVLIPLSFYNLKAAELPHAMLGYDNSDRFAKILVSQGHRNPRVVDLNFLFNTLIGIVEIHQRLMTKVGWTHGYFAKARLLNVWRTVPFLDVPSVLDGFDKYGAPMCLDKNVTIPVGSDPENFAEVEQFEDVDSEHAKVLLQSLSLFALVAHSFGLPVWMDHDSDAGTSPYHEELASAGRRASEVQRIRNLHG